MTTENTKLKLNYKNTILIGMAFFSITLLWTVYNQYCPVIIEETLLHQFPETFKDSNDTLSIVGIIMALDNLFALFMLPLFGTLSDKTKCSFGKRMIYVFPGMIVSAILFPLISIAFLCKAGIAVVVILIGLVLIVMNIYRNPAVALMPDVTPKPLRSKANGIINFVGYIGGAIGGLLMTIFGVDNNTPGLIKSNFGYIISFIIASIFMVSAAIILVTTIKENKLLKETEEQMKLGEAQSETFANVNKGEKLTKQDKKNMFILLFGVLFWFFSFNAVESFASLFCKNVLNNNASGTIVIVLTATSLISFILLLNVPAKIGRKNTILLGILIMAIAFSGIIITLIANGVFSKDYNETLQSNPEYWTFGRMIFIYIFAGVLGIGWALINANSYPMMVELASGKNIGKYTGVYYTFSMVAQTLTPIVAGLWMQLGFGVTGLKALFVYSLVMICIAGIIMIFFKEKKTNKIEKAKRGFEALDND